jgi:hypothetical protein
MATCGAAAALRRDPEIEDVLAGLEAQLREMEHARTGRYDDKLAIVEALAAPYALVFVHEIRRLDDLVLKRHSRRPFRKNARTDSTRVR